jgi:hypothetical protein
MMVWEYKTIKLEATGFWMGGNVDAEKLDLMMNGLGQQGWELAAALDAKVAGGNTKDVIVIFKRPRN